MEQVQAPTKGSPSTTESIRSTMQAGPSRPGSTSPHTPPQQQQQQQTTESDGQTTPTRPTAMAPSIVACQHDEEDHAVPCASTTNDPHQQQAQASSSRMRLPTAAERRRAREMATLLLTLTLCQECSRPVQEPISLPCGHAICLQCVKDRCLPRSIPAEEDVPVLPCMTHLPPRLPLSPMTVPCPVNGCPRSAIGRGIGAWSGHRPRYGLVPTYTERLPVGDEHVGPGAPPVDGFVIGVADHPHRLTVIGPQSRSKAHLFAVPPMGVEPTATGNAETNASLMPSLATSNLLRPDVTLSKAVALLKRYASSPAPHSPRSRRFTTSRGGARHQLSRHIASRGSRFIARTRASQASRGTGSNVARRSLRSNDRRLHPSRSALSALGANESDLESGTINGVLAAAPDTEEDDDDYDSSASASGLAAAIFADAEDEDNDDLWPDGVGGAFARPLLGNSNELEDGLKRRRAGRAAPSLRRIQEADSSGWSTDEDKASLSLSSKIGPHGQPLVQTIATLHAELLDVLECQLCYLLLYQPLTTPCGHTFCKPCFARSLDHGNKCPLCRAEMPSFAFFQDHPSNGSLYKMLTTDTASLTDGESDDATPRGQKLDDLDSAPHHFGFKALYENRKAAIEQEEREARLSTPIFVCTLAFPSMPTILHIFEPRYRLMVRRCLESGNPRFGMVLPSKTNGGLEEYGTMLEIKSVQMLADGRSMLETVGSYRFKLLEKGSLDGYTVGRIERLDDISLEEEAEQERAAMLRRQELDKKAEEQPLITQQEDAPLRLFEDDEAPPFAPLPPEPSTEELVEICTSFIETLRSGSAPWLLSRLNHTYGPMPEAHEVERLGYWMALVMPIDEHEKAKLLPITSRRMRLCLVVHWIEQLRQSWWFSSGCTVS